MDGIRNSVIYSIHQRCYRDWCVFCIIYVMFDTKINNLCVVIILCVLIHTLYIVTYVCTMECNKIM